MASQFPYTLYVCPCTDINTSPAYSPNRKSTETRDEQSSDEQNFNPYSPRANYALYPLENLLFCNECHELRCPKCYYEEAVNYYCPCCLFEVPSNIIKETNRCTRSCFQCPICISNLGISAYPSVGNEPQPDEEILAYRERPCILSCPWCHWTSLEIGLVFEKATDLGNQLTKFKNGGQVSLLDEASDSASPAEPSNPNDVLGFSRPTRMPIPTDQYSQLTSFYKNQLLEITPARPFGFGHNFGLDSPSQLSRLLSTYGIGGLKKQKDPSILMREALDRSEGLRPEIRHDADEEIIARMQTLGWEGTSSTEQCKKQAGRARFLEDLRPICIQLRTKRSKRCRTCRHNLVKLSERSGRWRYQIRLVALHFIPKILLRPLDHTVNLESLLPSKTVQLLLTFHNPLFDPVKVTLATSPTTPGKIASKITILCPQFDIGANTDVWNEALDTTTHVERTKARDALEGTQAEAGKIWESGRAWTSVIMEIVPGNPNLVDKVAESPGSDQWAEKEDAILEIPLFVRLEYETDDTSGDTPTKDAQAKAGKERKVRRELSFWCVLGAGKIASTIG